MKSCLAIAAIFITSVTLINAQNGSRIISADDIVNGLDRAPATRSIKGSASPPVIIKRETTAPSIIINNYERVAAASTTRGGSNRNRGIDVVPVPANPQQVNVSVEVEQNAAMSFNIKFIIDTAEFFDGNANLQMDEIAKAMNRLSGFAFLVEGHTCDLGDDDHNKALSDKRAARIVTELKARGVGAERLLPLGFGEKSPAVENTSESNRQTNRRVTIYKRA